MKNEIFLCECGSEVTQFDDRYECLGCKLKVFKKFMGKDLAQDEVKKLFYGNGIKLDNLYSSTNKRYNIQVYYNNGDISLEYI